uniref:Uncharacterized protein n=1 Tax=Strigamia maritima TaxID=126957 RepID=T1JKC6_STRMM
MAERRFTRALSKPGSAAQLRETVSQAVRESSVMNFYYLPDYNIFIVKKKKIKEIKLGKLPATPP